MDHYSNFSIPLKTNNFVPSFEVLATACGIFVLQTLTINLLTTPLRHENHSSMTSPLIVIHSAFKAVYENAEKVQTILFLGQKVSGLSGAGFSGRKLSWFMAEGNKSFTKCVSNELTCFWMRSRCFLSWARPASAVSQLDQPADQSSPWENIADTDKLIQPGVSRERLWDTNSILRSNPSANRFCGTINIIIRFT